MHALPSVLALVAALLLARPLLRALRAAGRTRPNHRGVELPVPFGVLVPIAALIALAPLMLIDRLASEPLFGAEQLTVALYCLGVIALGLIDDLIGGAHPRGVRGHALAVARGGPSTGAVKAFGALGAALLATSYLHHADGRWLLAAAVLVLATHVFNLLDLRPGRAAKALVLLGVGLALGSRELRATWAVGLFAAPALVAGAWDMRERAMLGDTGASLLGAVAGLLLVLTLSRTGQLVALAALVVATVYGELRSISALIERTPGLRELDSWGRPS